MEATRDTTLAELAVRHPDASRLFHRVGLDYCCGGKRTVGAACEQKGLDAQSLLDELERTVAPEGAERWTERPLPELVDFILTRYHEPLREELPELVALAEKVEDRHREKPSRPSGLAEHLRLVQADVLQHLAKEEQVLFPLILAGHGARAGAPIQAMEQEHQDHGRNLARIRALTNDLCPPLEACVSWRALYLRLDELEAGLMEHIHLENNVLFPRALCA